MLRISLGVLITLTILSGCTKNETKKASSSGTTGQSYGRPAADLLASFSFKPGTFWIYRDSISGVEDSVYVHYNLEMLQIMHYTSTGPNNGYYYNAIELFHLRLDSPQVTDGRYWHYLLNGSSLTVTQYGRYLCNFESKFPFVVSSAVNGVQRILPSYTVLDSVYSNVAELHESGNYFFAGDGIGMVKMKILNPHDSTECQFWELERYKIVK